MRNSREKRKGGEKWIEWKKTFRARKEKEK